MLPHGFQIPYQGWVKYMEHNKKDFRAIVRLMPGHNLKRKKDCISFVETAKYWKITVSPVMVKYV